MSNIIEREDFVERLQETTSQATLAPAAAGMPPTERAIGAQPVAVRRDEGSLFKKLRVLAAAAGDDWFYRFPVRKKVKNEKTGRDEWVTDYIEGPSIKCANNVARLYGNCDIDCRVIDYGPYWTFYARFSDLETGYSLTRPYQQRKSQTTMNTKDPQRAQDIAFQIGASKAIRNVVINGLEFFTSFAFDEAKQSIIDKVGRKLDYYRQKITERLAEMKIDLKAVEGVRGRALKDWLASDVARTIAELQAIQDGMATVGETYLGELPEGEQGEAREAPKSVAASLDEFAGKAEPAPSAASEITKDAEEAREGGGEQAEGSYPKPPAAADDPLAVAHRRGQEAKASGAQRKSLPPEYRAPPRDAEAKAWQRGFDGKPLDDKGEASLV
jgi:hypothetical protein